MSLECKRGEPRLVICDSCGDYSWCGDHSWRLMPHSTVERLIHLCPACRPGAVWCAAHQQYHRPDALHRHACADCGGLFTSAARDAISRCPSCRRAAGDRPAPPQPRAARPVRSLAQRLSALRPNLQRYSTMWRH